MELSAFFILLIILPFSMENSNSSRIGHEKILSRKRRYLVFPEGSSLQLVYCLTMPSLGMGRIFTIGSTAAMAWILPNEPMVFLDKKKKKQEEKQEPELHLPVHDEFSDLQYNHDYEPAFLSQDNYPPNNEDLRPYQDMDDERSKYYNFEGYNRVDRPPLDYYRRYSNPTFGQYSVEPEHWHIYRRTRRSLYGKLEKLLNALSKDGRACILKLICEVSQVADRKGTFMEEVVKVIFRIRTHENMVNKDMYDTAANKMHNCSERYKSCPGSFFGKW